MALHPVLLFEFVNACAAFLPTFADSCDMLLPHKELLATPIDDPEFVNFMAKMLGHLNAVDVAIDALGRTALHLECERGRLGSVELLVGRGADVDLADKYGKTPLMFACRAGHVDVVRLLVGRGADVEKADKYGMRRPR